MNAVWLTETTGRKRITGNGQTSNKAASYLGRNSITWIKILELSYCTEQSSIPNSSLLTRCNHDSNLIYNHDYSVCQRKRRSRAFRGAKSNPSSRNAGVTGSEVNRRFVNGLYETTDATLRLPGSSLSSTLLPLWLKKQKKTIRLVWGNNKTSLGIRLQTLGASTSRGVKKDLIHFIAIKALSNEHHRSQYLSPQKMIKETSNCFSSSRN